jgi:glycosyltransferase involved in cell wall biosynthesis
MGKKITVSVISDLTTDQRVIRICTTLQQMGFEVRVIARCFKNSLVLDNYSFSASRIKCHFNKGFLQYAEFNIKLFFKLLFIKTDYFLANDLDTLLPIYLVSKLKNKKIFYDTHEYFTGVPELKHNHTKRKIWKWIEDKIFPKLPIVYTVNNAVKNEYEKEYGNTISVVRNVPFTRQIVKSEMPLKWQNKKVLLMQGAGINEGRGGMELLQTMPYLPAHYYLVYIGDGTLWNKIKSTTIELGLQNRVEMINKLPPNKLAKYTPHAYLGFSLDGFNDINYLFNLPNKVFDFMHAGVPVIATAIPEVKAIIDEFNCGICIQEQTPKAIAEAILKIEKDENRYQQLKANSITAAKVFCWENESEILKNIYQSYL